MSAITAKANRKMKKYAVLTREPRCFLGSFDFSWEQRKAIDIADYSKGNGYSKGDLTDAGTPIILYGRLYTKYQFAISEVDTFAFPRNGAVYSQGNEVIVPASGETAEDIARASAVEKSGVLLGGDLNILRPFDFINPLFLALAISNGEPQKELAKKAQGKSVVHIHNTDIQEVTIAYPSRTEQDRIVSVFRQLDNLITLHQRKCALLFSPFQALISMMFTTSTFSWEQRKLGDISEIKTGPFGSTLHADDYVSDGTPIITTEHFKTGALPRSKNGLPQVSDSDYKRLTAYTLDDGDIVFSRVGSVDINALITPFQSNWLFSGRVLRVRPQTDISSKFLHTRLETESIKTDIRTRAVGQTMPSINTEILKITPLVLPSSAAEQEQIGSYFAALDNLITLHQRKCISFTGRAGRLISTVNKKRITSSWEQRKVLSCIQKITDFRGRTPKKLGMDWSESGYLALSALNVKDGYIDFSQDVHYGDQALYDKWMSGNELHKGQVLFTTEAPMGNVAQVPDNRQYILSQRTIAFDVREDIITENFLATLLRSPAVFNTLTSLSSGGTAKGVSQKSLAGVEVRIPVDLREQALLATYFHNLDNLITLHQRKPFLMKWRNSDANRNQTNRLVL